MAEDSLQDGPERFAQTLFRKLAELEAGVRACVRALLAHHPDLAPPASPAASPAEADAIASLTETELTIVKLIGEGKENDAIAKELCRSLKTIETHKSHAKKKLKVEGERQFIQFAWRVRYGR